LPRWRPCGSKALGYLDLGSFVLCTEYWNSKPGGARVHTKPKRAGLGLSLEIIFYLDTSLTVCNLPVALGELLSIDRPVRIAKGTGL